MTTICVDKISNNKICKFDNHVACNPIFDENKHDMEKINSSKKLNKFHEKLLVAGIRAMYSKNFCELAWSHIQRCCKYRHKETPKEAFRRMTLLSDKTFDRIEDGTLIKPTLETVMAICVGLDLGAVDGILLLKSAGYDFSDTQSPILIAYLTILHEHVDIDGIFDCNELLIAHGYPPLCKKEYEEQKI